MITFLPRPNWKKSGELVLDKDVFLMDFGEVEDEEDESTSLVTQIWEKF